MPKSINEWLAEGETLYTEAMGELQDLESQLAALEERLAAKQSEVNKLAQVIGKAPLPPMDSTRKVVNAQVVGGQVVGGPNGDPHSIPNSPATIARALTGRGLGR